MSGDLTERRVQAIREAVDEYGMALTITNIKRILEADPATELLARYEIALGQIYSASRTGPSDPAEAINWAMNLARDALLSPVEGVAS